MLGGNAEHNRMKIESSTSKMQHSIHVTAVQRSHSKTSQRRYDYELVAKLAEEELEKNKAQIGLMAREANTRIHAGL